MGAATFHYSNSVGVKLRKLSSPRATFACGTHASLQYRRRLVRDRPSRRRLAASFAVDVVAPRRPCSTFTPADATQIRHARRSLSAFTVAAPARRSHIVTPAAAPHSSPSSPPAPLICIQLCHSLSRILCRMLFSANADAVADADASASASACQCQSRCQSRCQSQCRVDRMCFAGLRLT